MTSSRARERLIKRLVERGIEDKRVLDAVRHTPRHLFVDEALSHRVYEDVSLPIGFNQTISQPYMVARMTEILFAGGAMNNVLEVGTGSGYQTSVLARLVSKVYSVERIKPLQIRARKLLSQLKQSNITFKYSDGSMGWAANAPYDGILVAAAPEEIPAELVEQLKVGGRMVIPVGESHNQALHLVVRTESGFDDHTIEPVCFVPLISGGLQ
ncbi:MAG: protein-L-isoaspartate(D-aspartate) O-methyltransferase [Pseudomonadales bacterium]|nr:protein-L-isoaspartate(D-aspartate) O-methyltransferase [Pseudomonadales bacterium]